MTQNERILRHLNTYGSITTYEAFSEYGITRLASRICDLRKDGYAITGKWLRGKTDTESLCHTLCTV